MTVEELKETESKRLIKAYEEKYNRTVSSLVSLAKDTIHDSAIRSDVKKEITENLKAISEESLKYLFTEIFDELCFEVNGDCTFNHLARSVKELKALQHDINYLG
jgi:hypothetical protein